MSGNYARSIRVLILLLHLACEGTEARAVTRGVSGVELITLLQQQEANRHDIHPQTHQGEGPPSLRRQLQSTEPKAVVKLTPDNAKPIRIRIDFESLDESKAPKYSACFKTGEWFRRGLPAQTTPPSDGKETCVRSVGENSDHEGCWGRCLASDVINPQDAKVLKSVVTSLVAEVPERLSLLPVANLRFAVSKGAYERALIQKGYEPVSRCASDCTVLSRVAVDERYCKETGGLANDYDAVLSITKPPGVEGVAGTGSSCATDQRGRPIWLVVAWHSSIVGMAEQSTAQLVEQHRGFFRHEVFHAMGFSGNFFNCARAAAASATLP